jgi:hypothetical protein
VTSASGVPSSSKVPCLLATAVLVEPTH